MNKFNKFSRVIFTIVMMLGVALSSAAYDAYIDGIYYSLNSSSLKATVTYKSTYDYGKCYTGEIKIPETISYNGKTYTVTTIGSDAFYNSTVDKVYIPRTVTSISSDAFKVNYSSARFFIESSTLTIDKEAFKMNMGDFYFMSENVYLCNYSSFYNFPYKIYVSESVYSKYTSSSVWKNANIEKFNWSDLTTNFPDKFNIIEGVKDDELTGTVSFSGSGSGTENDPFLIFNPVQLNDVRNSVGHSGIYYKLMRDIDMTEWIAENNPQQGWQPIGNLTSMFKGTFIGNGKKITGITINRGSTNYVGLFGYIRNATITDLTIEGNIIGQYYTGGLFGVTISSLVENCSFNGEVSGHRCTGGIAGASQYSIINNCRSQGKVSAKDIGVGGIVGWTLVRPFNSIYSFNDYILGNYTGKNTISNSISNCDITSQGDCVGGIVGFLEMRNIDSYSSKTVFTDYTTSITTIIENCKHTGKVSGSNSIGGIVGKILTNTEVSSEIISSSCTSSTTITNCQHIGDVTGSAYVGGIIGNNQPQYLGETTTQTISNNSFIGDLTNSGDYTGGIIGYQNDWSSGNFNINNCYALSNINSQRNYVGGLVGKNKTSLSTSDCYFSGSIIGNDYVGGIAGNGGLNITNSYSNASIVSGRNYVGGIAGYLNSSSTVKSCVATNEKVNATNEYVGRIYGYAGNGATIGTMNTTEENKGLATTIVNLNGVQQLLEDGSQHGTNVGRSTLKLKSTYQGLGWDFTTNWTNQETESYPYKQSQTAPPIITSTSSSGTTEISGKSVNDGTVYVEVGNKLYSTQVSNNTWSITVEPLVSGEIVTAYAKAGDLDESYRVYQTVGFAGRGTEDDPYQIYTAQELANVNGSGYYKLMNDIDLTEWITANSPSQGWIPLGRNGNVMSNLLGNNHTISGLWCNTEDDFTALIAVAEGITIKDLTVETATDKNIIGGNYTAVIIGKASDCTMINCHVTGSIVGGDYLGGLAGSVTSGSFENCSSEITIQGKNYIGGIMGYSSGSINNCFTNNTITGENYIGGIVGSISNTISNCRAENNITGINSSSDSSYAGGIAGYSTHNITNCYSKGSVNQSSSSDCYVGGITGYNAGASISNSYSAVGLSSSQYAAGIAGYNTGVVNMCYASGDISTVLFGAGIVGYNDGENAIATNCVAANNILAVDSETGIAMRVIGGIKNGAPTPESNNYALNSMVVSVNGVTQKIYDDVLHGMAKTQNILMQSATYTALGWDMSSIWGINEGTSYPYLRSLLEPTKVSSIILNITSCTLEVGKTTNLSATITPADATNQAVTWSSSNTSVATVNENGVVTAIGIGSTTISATTTDGTKLSASCEISVIEAVNNFFIINDMMVTPGSTFTLPIEMENTDDITGFQCNINLPEGIEFVTVDDEYDVYLSSRATSSHTLSSALQSDGSLLILVYSVSSKLFKDNSGELFYITLNVSEDFEETAPITINKIKVATQSAIEYNLPDVTAYVEKQSYIMGDANGDGEVSVGDIVLTANYILGNQPSTFVFAAADMTSDGQISIGDIVSISNVILSGGYAKTLSIENPMLVNNSYVSIDNFVIAQGETKVVAIKLSNPQDYTAFQMDVTLPSGLTLGSVSLSGCADTSHKLMTQEQNDSSIRLLSFSTNNISFNANENSLLLLEVTADDTFASGEICAKNIRLVDNYANECKMSDTKATVTDLSGIYDINNKSRIYSENNNIIIESATDQIISITSIDGRSFLYEVTAGKNIINDIIPGMYIVKFNSQITKIIIK